MGVFEGGHEAMNYLLESGRSVRWHRREEVDTYNLYCREGVFMMVVWYEQNRSFIYIYIYLFTKQNSGKDGRRTHEEAFICQFVKGIFMNEVWCECLGRFYMLY